MSEVTPGVDVPAAVDVIELEERRANRNLKHFVVRLISIAFTIVFVASMMSLIYAAVIQEKDLNTGFMGEMFKLVFDFLRFLLS